MANAAITLQMQPTGTACVKSMQGSSWPQSIIVVFQDADGKPVNLTGCMPRIFAGPNGAFNDGTIMDAFSGTAQFGVTPDMTAIPGQYACSFSLPNTSCSDFKVDRLTLKVMLRQDGIYYAFLNQVPGTNDDIQTQINSIKAELSSKVTEQDIQTAVSGISIGAVQLLPNSATLPTLHGWSQNSSTTPTDEGGGFYRLPLNSNVTEILQNANVTTIHGATYTESFYFRTDSTTLEFSFDFYESNNAKDNIVQAAIQNLGSGLYRAYATATVEDTAIRAIDIKDLVYTDGTYIDIGKPKFEYGNKATDYSEADADFNSQIGTINQTLLMHSSEINQNASDISLRVLTSTYNSYTATNDSNISSLQSRMSSAELKITDSAITSTVASNITGNQIISVLNQTATTYSIDASKINMYGYVTMTDLSTPGATTISGSNIDTANLKAQRIYSDTSGCYARIGSHNVLAPGASASDYTEYDGVSLYNTSNTLCGGIYSSQHTTPFFINGVQTSETVFFTKVFCNDDWHCSLDLQSSSIFKNAGLNCFQTDSNNHTIFDAGVGVQWEDSSVDGGGFSGVTIYARAPYTTGNNSSITITSESLNISAPSISIDAPYPSVALTGVNFSNYDSAHVTAEAIRIGTRVFLIGMVHSTASSVAAGTNMLFIPDSSFWPKTTKRHMVMSDGGMINVDVTSSGYVVLQNNISWNTPWIWLNGIILHTDS